jgi:small neutral amino acid transporter SnatA (MarC family)
MLHAFRLWTRSTPEEEQEAADKEDVAVIPLGIPILSGPGAITTAMVFAFQHQGLQGKLLVSLAALLTSVITYFVFRESTFLMKIMGHTGINLLTRIRTMACPSSRCLSASERAQALNGSSPSSSITIWAPAGIRAAKSGCSMT